MKTPGAKAARDVVARSRKENEAQAARARAERSASWPEAAAFRRGAGFKGSGVKDLVRVWPSAPGVSGRSVVPLAGGSTTVEVLDQRKARAAGITGVLFTARAQRPGRAEVSLSYGDFASAVGGSWSTRLGLVTLPACALTTPQKAECRKTSELDTTNDIDQQTLTGAATLSASSPTVFAAMATSGTSQKGAGDFEATPLSASSNWEAGGSSGAFTWSYPIMVPPVAAGPTPSVGLSYNSGSVDGRTANTNNQGSQVGEGFDVSATSYVERKYGTCEDDGHKDKSDLCWKYDNASLVLNGKASELVKDDTTGTWRLKNDDASQVLHLTGADSTDRGDTATDPADKDGEYWKVITGDGTTYTFGLNKLPGAGSQETKSVWTVPVVGDDAGEPGYKKGSSFM
ncbi:hypothetical protein [Streptomyces sp. NPDC006879]|uniref:hypothetical protein n=1 Tax=Streptomyces sp. NPDC006879 TaxID=3364767 RepID=UPI0036754EE4